MQQATIGFRDKSICRRVKFADTSFVAVTFLTRTPAPLSFSFPSDVYADIRVIESLRKGFRHDETR